MSTGTPFDCLVPEVISAATSDLPTIAGKLAEASAALQLRLTQPRAPEKADPETLITVEEAARIAAVSPRWVRDHTRGLSFRHDLSRKNVKLEEWPYRRWLKSRGSR